MPQLLQSLQLMNCRPRRSDIEILAGTVACPQCCGKGQYQRHTPNFARFFGLQEPWQDEVGLKGCELDQERSVPAYLCGIQGLSQGMRGCCLRACMQTPQLVANAAAPLQINPLQR